MEEVHGEAEGAEAYSNDWFEAACTLPDSTRLYFSLSCFVHVRRKINYNTTWTTAPWLTASLRSHSEPRRPTHALFLDHTPSLPPPRLQTLFPSPSTTCPLPLSHLKAHNGNNVTDAERQGVKSRTATNRTRVTTRSPIVSVPLAPTIGGWSSGSL